MIPDIIHTRVRPGCLYVVRLEFRFTDEVNVNMDISTDFGAILFPAHKEPHAFRVTRQFYFGPGEISDEQLASPSFSRGHWIPVESGTKDHSYTYPPPFSVKGSFSPTNELYTLAVSLAVTSTINSAGRKISVIPPQIETE